MKILQIACLLLFFQIAYLQAQSTITVSLDDQQQIIDGFGAHQGDDAVNQSWWLDLYYDDLGASIYRVDLTPQLVSPYSDIRVYSPWFMGSTVNSVFNFEDPDNPGGPEGNRVRTYTGPEDYSREFGGENAPIAVMGPDIDANVNYFTYRENQAITTGLAKKEELGDFKLIGSMWSPLPWVKVASGNSWNQSWWPGPAQGTPWPFIWGGNYAGGRLDVSNTPLEVFNDGTGPTSSLEQFARSTAAYIRGFQNFYGARFYAISIQNELNFEQYYNSATYPLSSQYIAAIKAVRAEFDQYEDLRDIRIMGPEDLLGGDAYGMWQYGGGDDPTHKNLQYLQNLAADPEALEVVDFFCIHGYDGSGVSSSGAASKLWDWWAKGWSESPAAGIPADVAGFTAYDKKSWMTETSGENYQWLFPTTGYPSNGGWGTALRIHQALTVGRESAWVYWTFSGAGDNGQATDFTLTSQGTQATSPKYVGAKHFFRHIRPGSYRVSTNAETEEEVLSSAYIHETDGTVTVVLINTNSGSQERTISIPGLENGTITFDRFTSSDGQYWQETTTDFTDGNATISLPGYSVVTLFGKNALATGLFNPRPDGPAPFRLFQNTPNPFSEQSRITFELDRAAYVELQLQDVEGKVVRTLLSERKSAGKHEVEINGRSLASGLYFCTLRAGGHIRSQKIMVK
ncbi:T9SS type A sorting domain-containing protein [Flavilitoribacter nigricans]|uniref:T9SS type A sorting domain-containing protein n=1 Tax=Flavilitoribacter nigricans (strain ATCC 23147 / DSM 23189 / NBRC 102662 / NCIMB 1420 / SS-2) TaxID=1122177 RepID=A0A2D0NJT9_FLAN2|nr:T9SS type A sorting domain-containing protein [Flavilitoribacter nigricans]PHN08636.1 hypothetical protein CRP01_01615 [Flavilitoribacter nigricans DSM 23189 = NBRC 102662]